MVAITDPNGVATVVNRYDEYGAPQGGNYGTFQYTGQMWLGEIGIYNYKNRMYWPNERPGGRFLQTDPVGPADSANLYQYALNDPVNLSDPLGLQNCPIGTPEVGPCAPISVIGSLSPRFGLPGGGFGVGRARGLQPRTPNLQGESPDSDQQDQCDVVARQRGKIVARGGTATAVLGLGLTGSIGTFRNLSTGSTGRYLTLGFGAGAIAGVSETESTYNDISSFTGYNESLVAGAGIPFVSRLPVIGSLLSKYAGFGVSLHRDIEGNNVGKSSDIGPGRSGIAGTKHRYEDLRLPFGTKPMIVGTILGTISGLAIFLLNYHRGIFNFGFIEFSKDRREEFFAANAVTSFALGIVVALISIPFFRT